MPSLFGRAPKDSFQELLKLNNTGAGIDSTMRAVQDGTGVNTPLQLSTTQIALNGAYWPTTLGTSGQVLTAGSNGTMTWTTAPTYAPLASPTFTGTPVAPTATAGANTTQLATTAFVTNAVASIAAPSQTFKFGSGVALNSGFTLTASNAGSVYHAYGTRAQTYILPALSSLVSGGGQTFTFVSTDTAGVIIASPDAGSIVYLGSSVNNFSIANGDSVVLASNGAGNWIVVGGSVATLNSTTVSNTYATLASAALTGTPTAPTATAGTNTTQLATTAFVHNTVGAIAGGLTFSGTWNATTNSPSITSGTGTTGQMYKVATAGTTTIDGNSSWSVGDLLLFDGTTWDKIDGQASEVVSFNSRFGAVSLTSSDVTTALGFTPANTATVSSTYAPLASPALTGTPVAPTATAGTNTTQIATTAFVTSAIVTDATGVASFNTRTGAVVLSSSDVTTALTFTPANAATVASTYAPLASPALTGVPVAPTATAGTNTTQLATTAFVTSAVPTNTNQLTNGAGFITSAGAPVQTVAGRTGAVVLSTTDISGIGSYATLASPALTGTPTVPTATAGTTTTQAASTAFVGTALSTYAPLASPVLTGTPTAPTATAGTNTTQLATTAFVTSAISGSVAGVASFNTRTGAVTLTSSDVTTALGTTATITASDYETALLSVTDVAAAGDPSFANVSALAHFDGLATNATSFVDVIGNTFTVQSGPTFATSPVKFGSGSALFNNAGALTTTSSVTDVQAGNFTIEAWVYPTTSETTERAIVCNGWAVQLYTASPSAGLTTTGLHAYISSSATSGAYVVSLNAPSANRLTINAWNHVAFTRNGNVFTTWVNGAQDQTSTSSVTIPTSPSFTAIGGITTNNSTYMSGFIGNIDDVRITKGVARYTTAFSVPTAAFPNTSGSAGTHLGFRSTGILQFGTTTGASNAGFAPVGQIDSTGLNATVIGATTPAAGTFTTLTATTPAIGTNSTQVASTAFVQSATQTNLNVALAAANVPLTATQYGSSLLTFTGTLTANVIVTFPTQGRWNLLNSTSGAFTVTVSNGTGATIVIPSGATLEVISNSTLGMLPASSMAATATAGTNTTQVATTAFVKTAITNAVPSATIVTATATSAGYTLGTTNSVFYNITQATSGLVLLPGLASVSQGWTATLYYNPGSTGTTMTLGANSSPQDYIIAAGVAASNTTLNVGYGYTITAIPSMNRWLVTKSI